MQTKRCFRCRKIKELDQFYRHKEMADGHLNKCKQCTKKDVRRRYHDPTANERITLYERRRAQDPGRKERTLEYQKIRRARYPGKNRARQAINNALRDGKIVKKPCEVCQIREVEAHHTDYRKPFDVKWLCHQHHLEAEGKKSRLSSQN